MNRFALILTALLIGLVAATSCSRTDPALARADAVMEQAPDSALAILESVDTATLRSERSRALYGLLLTQARVKCDVPIASDSLIAASARYFADHGPDSLTMRASFYRGWVLNTFKNYAEAIVPASKARDLAIKLDNPYWRAKSAELISYIYDATFYDEEGAKMSKEAADYYLKAGKILNHRYSLCDLGLSYANLSQVDRAINLEDSIFNIAIKIADTTLADYAISNKFSIEIIYGKYDSALKSQDRLEKINHTFTAQEIALNNILRLKLGLHVPDSVFDISSKTIYDATQEKIKNWEFLVAHARSNNNLEKVLLYTDSLVELQNKIAAQTVKQSVVTSLLKASEADADIERNHSESLKSIIFIGGISSIVVLLLLWCNFYNRMKLKNSKLECKMNEVILMSKEIEAQENRNSVLSSDLNAANTAVTEISQQLEHVIRDNWNTINNICDQYMQTDDSRASMSMLVKAIDSELAKMREDESIARMEHDIDLYMNGIVSRLRQECPSLKEDDIAFFCLICAGFTPRAVSLITGLKLKSFYTKKSRLIKRIEQSACPSAPDFLRALH